MKQDDIKVGRYYAGTNNLNVRCVTRVTIEHGGKQYVHWWPDGAGDTVDVRFHKRQLLKSFARWADTEVKPLYHPILRCDCGAWKWESDIGADMECERCGTPCNMWGK